MKFAHYHACRLDFRPEEINNPGIVAVLAAVLFVAATGFSAVNSPTATGRIIAGNNTPDFQYELLQAPPAVITAGSSFTIKMSVKDSTAYKFGAPVGEGGNTLFYAEETPGKDSSVFIIHDVHGEGSDGLKDVEGIKYLHGNAIYTIELSASISTPPGKHSFSIGASIQACEKKEGGLCSQFATPGRSFFTTQPIIPPVYEFTVEITAPAPGSSGENQKQSFYDGQSVRKNPLQTADSSSNTSTSNTVKSIWPAVLGLLVLGLLATLTPCTYPMIPLVVSQLGRGKEKPSFGDSENSGKDIKKPGIFSVLPVWLAYLLGMEIVCIPLGFLAGGAARFMSSVTTSIWFNALMAGLFVLFAFNLFGAFEIMLPASLQGKLQIKSRSRLGMGFLLGFVGIFVSFSCTAPLVAAAMTGVANAYPGRVLPSILGLMAFGLGFAVPYGFLILTASSLPRPGEWMITLKKALGIGMVLIAFWFLRSVIPGKAYFALSLSLTLLLLSVYTGAFLRLNSESGKFEHFRKAAGIAAFLFSLLFFFRYLDYGGWLDSFKPSGTASAAAADKDINWLDNLDKAQALAAREGKLILVDFRANSCSTCLEMEKNLFPLPSVVEAVKRDYVAVRMDISGNSPNREYAREVMDKYEVAGSPTFLFLAPDGLLLLKHPGSYKEDAFLENLKSVAAKWKKNR